MRRLMAVLGIRLPFSLALAGMCSLVSAQQPPLAASFSSDAGSGDAGYEQPLDQPFDQTSGPQGTYNPRPVPAGPGAGDIPPDVAGPPVARVSLVNGDVSIRRGDSNDAVAAAANAPLMAGDVIASAPGARAEIQLDFANRIRLGTEAEVRIAELQPGRVHIEIAHGTVSWSVVRESRLQVEISTPNVSARPLGRGLYRFWVRDDGQSVLTVRHGSLQAFTEKGSDRLTEGQTMFVRGGPQDPEYQVVPATAPDEWDRWNESRDQASDHAQSYQYVNPEMAGAEDLDTYGQWVNDPTYGEVWSPQEPADWAPYQDGRWVWEDYYGWTWLGYEPWGWAPYHYGSWFRGGRGWCWYPGPIYRPIFWRPALVAFFGFGHFGIGFGLGGWGNIGWVPLAPFERFSPWYGRGIFAGGFRTGFHIANVNIYNAYRNARVAGAVSGIAAGAFTAGRFNGAITRVGAGDLRQAGLVRGAMPIAPTANNLRFSNRATSVVPRSTANTSFYSRNPSVPLQRTSFTQQQQSIQRNTAQYFSHGSTSSATSPSSRAQVAPATAGRTFSAAPGGQTYGGASASGWSRFGTPSGTAANAAPRENSGWGRFGTTAAGGQSYRGEGQSIRIAPPIMRNRSYESPGSYSSPRGYATQSYSGPSASAPRSAPSYSAPRSSSSPHYSAPASHSSGGGHSGGGGGHHR